MKKSELKKYMIVETGYDNKKYLVVCNTLIDDNLKGYDLDFCFDDDLINNKGSYYSVMHHNKMGIVIFIYNQSKSMLYIIYSRD